jgi:hypothetical protein
MLLSLTYCIKGITPEQTVVLFYPRKTAAMGMAAGYDFANEPDRKLIIQILGTYIMRAVSFELFHNYDSLTYFAKLAT